MSTTNRAAILTKAHKVLKKHYKPVAPTAERSVLEHLLYACCLENATHEQADEAFARLQQSYFDWNEVRVTTVTELAEVMSMLPDAKEAAARLKRSLHAVFETHYSFDIDALRKQNIGKSVKELEKLPGVTPFVIAYLTQNGLGGHAVPVNEGALNAFAVLGVITDKEAKKHRVPGLERAIPKTKGVEFGSIVHQLGVDYRNTPFSNRVRGILLEIDPEAKSRFPKRNKPEPEPMTKKAAKAKPAKSASKSAKVEKKPAKKKAKAKTASKPKKVAKKSDMKRLKKKKPR